jgi:hypothetical protein
LTKIFISKTENYGSIEQRNAKAQNPKQVNDSAMKDGTFKKFRHKMMG